MKHWIALGLLAGIVLQYPIAGDADAQQRPDQDQAEPSDEADNGDLGAIREALERIAAAQDAQRDQSKAASDQQRAQDDLSAQQEMAKWAGPMFVATLLSAIFALGSVVALILIFRAQQKLSRDQTRAYLELGEVTIQAGRPPEFSVGFEVRNGGDTPAIEVFATGRIQFVPAKDDEGVAHEEPADEPFATLTNWRLSAKGTDTTRFWMDQADKFIAAMPEHSGSQPYVGTEHSRPAMLMLEGYLHYRDVFGGSHSIPFQLFAHDVSRERGTTFQGRRFLEEPGYGEKHSD